MTFKIKLIGPISAENYKFSRPVWLAGPSGHQFQSLCSDWKLKIKPEVYLTNIVAFGPGIKNVLAFRATSEKFWPERPFE